MARVAAARGLADTVARGHRLRNEETMAGCEQRKLAEVFKLQQTKRVAGMLTSLGGQNKKLIWHHAGGTGRESRRVRWFKTQLPAGANSPIGQD